MAAAVVVRWEVMGDMMQRRGGSWELDMIWGGKGQTFVSLFQIRGLESLAWIFLSGLTKNRK